MSGGGDMTARSGDCAAVLIPLHSTTTHRTTPEPRIPGWMGRCRCCSQRHESKYQVPLELGPVWHEWHVCCLKNCTVGIGIPEQINQQSLDGHIICLGEEHSWMVRRWLGLCWGVEGLFLVVLCCWGYVSSCVHILLKVLFLFFLFVVSFSCVYCV